MSNQRMVSELLRTRLLNFGFKLTGDLLTSGNISFHVRYLDGPVHCLHVNRFGWITVVKKSLGHDFMNLLGSTIKLGWYAVPQTES